ncbi:MAG: SpoIIE family protein phosphatase [Bacteroidota bacterium]
MTNSYAQQGNLYLVNYDPGIENIKNQHTSIIQDLNGIMYFAGRRGVLTYDGVKWELLKTPSSAYSVAIDSSNGRVYVGCRNNFGYLEKDETGKDVYVSISHQEGNFSISSGVFSGITDIAITKNFIYFYCYYHIFRFSRENNEIDYLWNTDDSEPFTGLINTGDELYVNIAGSGLHKVEDKILAAIPSGEILLSVEIITALHYRKDTFLVGTSENEIYLFNARSAGKDDRSGRIGLKPFSFEARDYLLESILAGGIELSDNQFVLSTLTGGCVFIDKETGKTSNILNYQTGLPDDEIYAMGKDRNGGLWISHDYGITRVDNSIPVRNFSLYPGLEGNIISVIDFDRTVYVATSEGVFYLTEVKNFKELEIYIKEPRKKTDDSLLPLQRTHQKPPIGEDEILAKRATSEPDSLQGKKQKGVHLFGLKITRERKTKREKEKAYKTVEDSVQYSEDTLGEEDLLKRAVIKEDTLLARKGYEQNITALPGVIQQPETLKKEYKFRKVYALQSIKYIYKQVNGLKGKCRQLIRLSASQDKIRSSGNDRLLVASNTGLYEIFNKQAKPIIKDPYINCIYATGIPNLFFIGLSTGMKSIYFTGDLWIIEEDIYQDIQRSVYSIAEDYQQNFWLGCENFIYKLTIDSTGRPDKVSSYAFSDNFSEIISVRIIFGKPFFERSASEIYSYNYEQDSIFLNDEINSYFTEDSRMTYSQQGITWGYNGYNWAGLSARALTYTGLDKRAEEYIINEIFLNLFNNIKQIYVDAMNDRWIIDGEKSIFKINKREEEKSGISFDMYIKSVNNISGTSLSFKDITLDYNNNSIVFFLNAPFYINETSTKYQYIVDGLTTEWSPWGANSIFEFSFLPAGNFTFRVRAKNVLGILSEEKSFPFKVFPPYWRSWWFYLLCLIIGITTVYFFIKFRISQIENEKKVLEQKVAERTEELARKNKDITGSIRYAKRIQDAILPSKEKIHEIFPESFMLFKPKDIVSGDFFWITAHPQSLSSIFLAVCDCTGHGVPGAFMSLIGNELLNDIVNKGILNPSEVLKEMHNGVVAALKKEEKDSETVDGMDVALFNLTTDPFPNERGYPTRKPSTSIKSEQGGVSETSQVYTLEFAGAGRPLILVRNTEHNSAKKKQRDIEIIKGDKLPIGLFLGTGTMAEKEREYKTQKLNLRKGDTVYLFTDGYCDQFGGEDGRKFTVSRFSELLLDIQKHKMAEQGGILDKTIEDWKGTREQVDDMLVIGIRI